VSAWIPAALVAIGLVAILLELFVPSFGIIGVVGFGCLVAAVWLSYVHLGPTVGTVVLAVVLVLAPALVVLGLKLFPRTFVGRWLIHREDLPRPEARHADLAGATGSAITDLRPAGMALVARRRLSVVTGGEFIGRGEPVTVVAVEGSRIVVRRSAGVDRPPISPPGGSA
jgi:membrane-bound serine protease (ClpP class)